MITLNKCLLLYVFAKNIVFIFCAWLISSFGYGYKLNVLSYMLYLASVFSLVDMLVSGGYWKLVDMMDIHGYKAKLDTAIYVSYLVISTVLFAFVIGQLDFAISIGKILVDGVLLWWFVQRKRQDLSA